MFLTFSGFFRKNRNLTGELILSQTQKSLKSGGWVARFVMVPIVLSVLQRAVTSSKQACWAAQLFYKILCPALWGMCFLTFMFSISHKTGLKYIVFCHSICLIMTVITLYYCCSFWVHYISIPNEWYSRSTKIPPLWDITPFCESQLTNSQRSHHKSFNTILVI